MKQKIILSIILIFSIITDINAQNYLTNKSKYQFAQGAMGLDFLYIPKTGTSTLLDSNGAYNYQFGGYFIPRLAIGGTHFWGHADVVIHFPVGKFGGPKDSLSDNAEFDIIATKYYPWAIQKNKIRPYIGTAFNVNVFRQVGSGIYKSYYGGSDFKLTFPINFGASYQKGSLLFNLDAKINYNINRQIYASRNDVVNYKLPAYAISFGVRKLFEGTAPQFEKKYLDGTMAKKYQATKNKLNAFSFGFGFSSSFYTGVSNYNKTSRPFLTNRANTALVPEFGVGYYLNKPDVHFNIAYRNIIATNSGFGILQTYSRNALTLEVFKFLYDYKGFVPFAGIGISKENLSFTEKDFIANNTQQIIGQKYAPSIIAGWDIRYHRNYYFMLRTNIRYSPFLKLSTSSSFGNINFNQLEINFIQAVFYPQRLFQKIQNK
jgi:hypothetical protein